MAQCLVAECIDLKILRIINGVCNILSAILLMIFLNISRISYVLTLIIHLRPYVSLGKAFLLICKLYIFGILDCLIHIIRYEQFTCIIYIIEIISGFTVFKKFLILIVCYRCRSIICSIHTYRSEIIFGTTRVCKS